jgi:hypothetical protein
MKAIAFDMMADAEESYWWYRARREILCDVIRRLAPPGSNIVDSGAGFRGRCTRATLRRLASGRTIFSTGFCVEGILLRWVSLPAGASLPAVARFNRQGPGVA